MLELAASDVGRPFQDLAVAYRPVDLRGRIEEADRTAGRPPGAPGLPPPARRPDPATIDVTPLFGPAAKRFATAR